jgi:hypothetical protein
MPAVTIQASMTNDITGALNPALVDFTFPQPGGGAPDVEELAARVIAYLAISMYSAGSGLTSITGCRAILRPSGTFSDLPFPAAEYQALRTSWGELTGLPGMTAYSQVSITGGGQPSGRGDSVCVNTKAASGGRKGNGRHFLPFTDKGAIDGQGLINTALINLITRHYDEAFLGVHHFAETTLASVNPGVFSKLDGVLRPITIAKPSQIPSRLRSRTK